MLLTQSDFEVPAGRDPAVHREYLAERGRERIRASRRLEAWETRPETPDAQILARAEQIVAERRQFAASDKGRFIAHLNELETLLVTAQAELEAARAACARSFETERPDCEARAAKLFNISKKLTAAALAAGDACA